MLFSVTSEFQAKKVNGWELTGSDAKSLINEAMTRLEGDGKIAQCITMGEEFFLTHVEKLEAFMPDYYPDLLSNRYYRKFPHFFENNDTKGTLYNAVVVASCYGEDDECRVYSVNGKNEYDVYIIKIIKEKGHGRNEEERQPLQADDSEDGSPGGQVAQADSRSEKPRGEG